jgi:hypothetical protein
MKALLLTAVTALVALLGAACSPGLAQVAKPGCDRNGDHEQRAAC